MKYPCVVEPRTTTTPYGVVFPDLPGCYSVGETFDKAMDNAKEAAELWFEEMIDSGYEIAKPSALESVVSDDQWKGWIVSFVDIDITKLSGKTERINICLPKRIIRRIDERAKQAGESRSGFIASLAMRA